MSHMDPAYPNSIENTWRKEATVLYYKWHQNKVIKRKCKLHIPNDNQEVIKKYTELKNIPNEEEFLLERELFLKYIFSLNKIFYHYFKTYYCDNENFKTWAMPYTRYSRLNVNMFAESNFRLFKKGRLEG